VAVVAGTVEPAAMSSGHQGSGTRRRSSSLENDSEVSLYLMLGQCGRSEYDILIGVRLLKFDFSSNQGFKRKCNLQHSG
jgi:hypothetical protein